jgi:DNA polymerase elongation subunit (family B)
MKVVYAHTDSIYVPIESVEKAQEICKEVNTHVQKLFPNLLGLSEHPVQLEFEKYYQSLGVGCTKNRNAGYISWKDGKHLEEPEFIVTGFSMKRISENKIGREFQKELLQKWASVESYDNVMEYCKIKYNDVKKGRIPLSDIIKRGRVRKALNEYASVAGGIAGVCYYNQHISPNDPITDSFLFIECSHIDGPQWFILPNGKNDRKATYVAVKEMKEFDARFIPNWNAYATKSIVRKAKPIFDAMGWNIKDFTIDENQQNLSSWLGDD